MNLLIRFLNYLLEGPKRRFRVPKDVEQEREYFEASWAASRPTPRRRYKLWTHVYQESN